MGSPAVESSAEMRFVPSLLLHDSVDITLGVLMDDLGSPKGVEMIQAPIRSPQDVSEGEPESIFRGSAETCTASQRQGSSCLELSVNQHFPLSFSQRRSPGDAVVREHPSPTHRPESRQVREWVGDPVLSPPVTCWVSVITSGRASVSSARRS